MPEFPDVGEEFAGYRVQAVIGCGTRSVVYQADHPRFGRDIALKVMAAELAADDIFRARFLDETRIAASMNDPHVIAVYDVGTSDGRLYSAMHRATGGDLRHKIAKNGPLPPSAAVALLGQAARALDAAHRSGLVHRDLKPENLLLDGDDHIGQHLYLADFGISRLGMARNGLTSTGRFVGPTDYVAPEQISQPYSYGSADQYSLGCILFECLTGQLPLVRDPEAAATRPALRADLPPTVRELFARVLAERPGDRYNTCREFIEAAGVVLAEVAPFELAGEPAGGHAVRTAGPALANGSAAATAPPHGRDEQETVTAGGAQQADAAPAGAAHQPEGAPTSSGYQPDTAPAGAAHQPEGASTSSGYQPEAATDADADQPDAAPDADADQPDAAGYQRDVSPAPTRVDPQFEVAEVSAPAEPDLSLTWPTWGDEPTVGGPSDGGPSDGGPSGRGRSGRGRSGRGRSGGGRSARWIAIAAVLLLVCVGGGVAGYAALSSHAKAAAPMPSAMASASASASPVAQRAHVSLLTQVLTAADESKIAMGMLPSASCTSASTTMTTCTAPSPAIARVTFTTYPTLTALYSAYEALVGSLHHGRYQANVQDCGPSAPNPYGEIAWNHREQHSRAYTVQEMIAGTVSVETAMGRMACIATARNSEDVVWTTDYGKLLGVAIGRQSHTAVWLWWAAVHHNIIFPGTPMDMGDSSQSLMRGAPMPTTSASASPMMSAGTASSMTATSPPAR